MPICCHATGKSRSNEVRIDDRFLVFASGNNIVFFSVHTINSFYVSIIDNGNYTFGINNTTEFTVSYQYAYALYEKLLALCPRHVLPWSNTAPIQLCYHSYDYMTIDFQNVTLYKRKLFGKTKTKTVLTTPLKNIRSCYQVSEPDEIDTNHLYLRMYDGTEQKIGHNGCTSGPLHCFQIACNLKAVLPELIYEFPVPKK